MNDFSELEDQLRKLRPAQPSVELAARIEHALTVDEKSSSTAGVLVREPRFRFNWLSIGLGLAAATALVFFAFVRLDQPVTELPSLASRNIAPSVAAPSTQLLPAGLTQVVYHTQDEGVHFPTNSERPMRRVRSHTRETVQWRNPKTGATLRISYPTEQVSLVPLSGQ